MTTTTTTTTTTSSFSLHHRQFPTKCTFSSSPFLRPKPTFFLSPPLLRTSSFLPFHLTFPRPTRSPPIVVSSHRWWAQEEEPPPVPPGHEDQDVSSTTKDLGNPEAIEECRKYNWTEYGWAPWEEILSTEANFARKSLDEGEEVPLTTPEAIEAFKMLTPSYRKKKVAEIGEEEYLRRLFEIKGEIPEKLKTIWAGPLALQLVPPRDWPPNGWEVDKKELEFIREAHKLQSERVDIGGGQNWPGAPGFVENLMEGFKEGKEILDAVFGENKELEAKYKEWVKTNPDRLKMDDTGLLMKNDILKQYKEWVSSNRDEGSEGEVIEKLEKAVRRFEEFSKQHKEKAKEITESAKQEATNTVNEMAFERYKLFVKQYTEWVDAHRDKLEEESYKVIVKLIIGVRKEGCFKQK